jgi:transaldolase
LLDKLSASTDPIEKKLDAADAASMDITKIDVDEKTFRWMMNEEAMATEKLAEGIRNFAADIVKLEAIIKAKM